MDQKLLFLINREWTNPLLDRVMALMSSFAVWAPLLALLIVLTLWRGGFRARAFVLTAALIVTFNDVVISNSIKHLVHRPRPFQELDNVRQVRLAKARPRLLAALKAPAIKLSEAEGAPGRSGRSFPSSHTVNTISLALITACFYRRFGWISFFPALLVAYSRVYNGAHWPSDVITSLFLGVGATLMLLALLDWFWRARVGRFFPAFHARHPSLLMP
jgi:undecaprenyl-diphosphatase